MTSGPWERTEYQLSAEQNEAIFQEEIVPTRLLGKPSRSNPVAIVQCAQPGAGKSATGRYLGAHLGAGAYVIADSDLYKPYHPEYERLMREDDRAMTAATRLDGREWMAKAQRFARENSIDVLIDHTVDDLDYFRRTLIPYRDAGYRIVVYTLAVPEALSRQGIIDRYQMQRAESGSGRLTVASKAAAAYRGVLDGADLVEREGLAQATVAVRRGLVPRYYNHVIDGQWARPPGLREAVERERELPLQGTERGTFLERQEVLRREVGDEFGAELDEIDRLAEPLLIEPEHALQELAALGPEADIVIARARLAGLEAESSPSHPELGLDEPEL